MVCISTSSARIAWLASALSWPANFFIPLEESRMGRWASFRCETFDSQYPAEATANGFSAFPLSGVAAEISPR